MSDIKANRRKPPAPGFDRRRPILAKWSIHFPEGRTSDELTPSEQLAIAGDFHVGAEQFARDAYQSAKAKNIDLGAVADMGPLELVADAERTAWAGMGLDFEVAHARRWLGIGDNATTSDVVKALDEYGGPQKKGLTAARGVIKSIEGAKNDAGIASESLPEMQAVAWLLAQAAELARIAVVKRAGNYVPGELRINLLQRCVENVRAADSSLRRTGALRLILAATDSEKCCRTFNDLVKSHAASLAKADKSERANKPGRS